MQAILDRGPGARRYFSDEYNTYGPLVYYPGRHQFVADKSETYAVEADNAELRHYLARLARKSRCFSRCLRALWRAVKLFVYSWHRRQLYRRAFPGYPTHVADFVCPWFSTLPEALAWPNAGFIRLPPFVVQRFRVLPVNRNVMNRWAMNGLIPVESWQRYRLWDGGHDAYAEPPQPDHGIIA